MFGDRLRRLRKEQNLSQEDLAELVGVHTNTISKWENGVIPNMKKIIELARVLGTTSTYLLGETDVSSRSNRRVDDIGEITQVMGSINTPAFIERLVKDNSMIVIENGGKFMLIPATPEGFEFVAKMNEGMPSTQATPSTVVM